MAASKGTQELALARQDRRCTWSAETMIAAVQSGRPEVAKWLRKNQCAYGDIRITNAAAENGDIAMLEILRQNLYVWQMKQCLVSAVRSQLVRRCLC